MLGCAQELVILWGTGLMSGETASVLPRADEGEVGFLTGHAPLMALLGDGVLRLGSGSSRRFKVGGGFMQVLDNQVRVVTEKAEAA